MGTPVVIAAFNGLKMAQQQQQERDIRSRQLAMVQGTTTGQPTGRRRNGEAEIRVKFGGTTWANNTSNGAASTQTTVKLRHHPGSNSVDFRVMSY